MKGKYFSFLDVIMSEINCAVNSYKNSIPFCHEFELKKKDDSFKELLRQLLKYTQELKLAKANTFINKKLVIEKSQKETLKGNN